MGRSMNFEWSECDLSSVDETNVVVSHSLYADDTIIFFCAYHSQLGYLRGILISFEVVSSCKVNVGNLKSFYWRV